ncbi:MAG: S-layer homology domain-containing protein, partial [Lachnospiraceae bacterium]|nr:S-layer homology domain-containing protein [Lachnospiraceae bacterium]
MKEFCRKGHLYRSGKRWLAILMSVCLIGTMIPIPARAETGETEDFGYEQEEENTPVLKNSTQDGNSEPGDDPAPSDDEPTCTCSELCTEDHLNSDCPVCGKEGVDLSQCKGKEQTNYALSGEAGALEVLVEHGGAQMYETRQTTGDFTVTGGEYGTDYTYENNVLTIRTETAVTIANTDPNIAATDRIEVAMNVSANITLAGVNIDVSSSEDTAAFKIADNSGGDVTITLADDSENTLKSGADCAGLQKNGLIGTLTIQGGASGTGKLTATSGEATMNGYGAGIGGGVDGDGYNITISGGTVTATGGGSGAGIGGGRYGYGSDITISGGTVTATGMGGAGIGGGFEGSGSYIIISGGSVKAVAGSNAIGSGEGRDAVTPTRDRTTSVYPLTIANPDSAEVYIDGVSYTPVNHKAVDSNDGNLYAYLTGKTHEVKVGEKTCIYMFDSDSSAFTAKPLAIYATNGGTLTYGTDYSYADGVLTIKTDTPITIRNTDPTTATTDRIEVESSVSANITLAGVNIDVSSLSGTAAFKIADNSTGNVMITLADDSENTLKSGGGCAGLQKNGSGNNIGKLTIQGGTNGTGKLNATGGENGAGIGGGIGRSFNGSNIDITGGIVTATGGMGGAGIGGGTNGFGSKITISGGAVTATGGYGAGIGGAGIGGGFKCFGSKITISGGVVTARGDSGAGIGGGDGESGSNITISGGSVTATSHYGAGIGGGEGGDGLGIIISGGSVKAVAGSNAIGGGEGRDAVTPTSNGTTPVYLLEIENEAGAAITINDTAYPTNHNGEKKIYAYLPAKTVAEPNVVTVGAETTRYIYDTKWLIVPTVTAPVAKSDLVYTGEDQALVAAGTTSGGTMVYSLSEDGTYTEDIPTGTDADTYTVWYKVNVGEGYADTLPARVSVTIAKAAPVITNAGTVEDQSAVYGSGEFTAPISDVAGTFVYKAGENTYNTEEQLKDYLKGVNVSASPVAVDYTFTPTDTTNYEEVTGTISFTIQPAPMSDIAPDIAVTTYSGSYDGAGHPVVGTDGITGLVGSDNRIYYSTDNKATWSATAPTITDAGTLDFYVKVTKPNYVWISERLTATVTPVALTDSMITVNDTNHYYTGQEIEPEITVNDGNRELVSGTDYTVTYTDNTAVSEGSSKAKVTISAKAGQTNYTGSATAEFTIERADAEIIVGTTSYNKTFGDPDFTLSDVSDTNTEANVQYAVTAGDDVISVSNGRVTILKAGSATITLSLPESANYNAAENKTITVNVAKKSGYTVADINRSYLYSRDNADTIDLSGYLPANCGNVNYGAPQVNGALYTEDGAPAVSDGRLSYTVKQAVSADVVGTIKVNVATDNYEDFIITVNVRLIDKIPVIGEAVVSGLAAPAAGKAPVYEGVSVSFGREQSEIPAGNITWSPAVEGVFAYDTAYTVSIRIPLPENCILTSETKVILNGKEAAEKEVDTDKGILTIRYAFPATEKKKAPEKPFIFTDVPQIPGNWKYESVKYVYDRGIMGGVGGSSQFQPDHPLTRAMFATVLYRMAGEPETGYSSRFSDVKAGQWYSSA